MNENITKTCKACQKELPLSSFTASKKTKDKKENKCKSCRQLQRPSYIYNCVVCGVDYITKKKSSDQCCSQSCVGDLRTVTSTTSVSCSTCATAFIKKLSAVGNNNYCSDVCYSAGVSKRLLGVYISRVQVECEHCKKTINVTKSRVEKQQYNFCDAACYKNGVGKTRTGEKSPLYKHELTEEERVVGRLYHEYGVWRTAVYTRDNFTCVCCGNSTSGNLIAHHLYSYHAHKELRTELTNGVTLCKGCHKEFHTVYGYKFNTTIQFIDFMNNRTAKRVGDYIE